MRAKIFFIIIIFSIGFLSVDAFSQSQLNLGNKPIRNELLVEILNDSEMKELAPPLRKHSLILRLYSVGVLGACAPDVETEVNCSFRYYLAVSDGGLGVPRTVYDLGEVGEITDVRWLEIVDTNNDRLRLEISNYPTHAFDLNPKLKRKTRIVELDVSLSSLKIKIIK